MTQRFGIEITELFLSILPPFFKVNGKSKEKAQRIK